jgi:hypothetical protein
MTQQYSHGDQYRLALQRARRFWILFDDSTLTVAVGVVYTIVPEAWTTRSGPHPFVFSARVPHLSSIQTFFGDFSQPGVHQIHRLVPEKKGIGDRSDEGAAIRRITSLKSQSSTGIKFLDPYGHSLEVTTETLYSMATRYAVICSSYALHLWTCTLNYVRGLRPEGPSQKAVWREDICASLSIYSLSLGMNSAVTRCLGLAFQRLLWLGMRLMYLYGVTQNSGSVTSTSLFPLLPPRGPLREAALPRRTHRCNSARQTSVIWFMIAVSVSDTRRATLNESYDVASMPRTDVVWLIFINLNGVL